MIANNSPDSPWPLFCGDLEQARGWVWQKLLSSATGHGQTAHWALSLGLQARIAHWLLEGDHSLSAEERRGLKFRLARNQHHPQAHRLLFSDDDWEALRQRWNGLIQREAPIRIGLQGGLGDHLQDLSALLPWVRANNRPVVFHLQPCRANAFQRLLSQEMADVPIATQGFARDAGVHVLELMALLDAPTRQPQSWIHGQARSNQQPKLVGCWTAVGCNDRFSAWSRSVAFPAVVGFYRQLLAAGWPPEAMVDISHWSDPEAALLRKLGIEQRNPAQGDLIDLVRLIGAETSVVTIDTALTHLCAALGKTATLLLPQFADERWAELLQPCSSYSTHMDVLQQRHFGSWQAELTLLCDKLCAGNPANHR